MVTGVDMTDRHSFATYVDGRWLVNEYYQCQAHNAPLGILGGATSAMGMCATGPTGPALTPFHSTLSSIAQAAHDAACACTNCRYMRHAEKRESILDIEIALRETATFYYSQDAHTFDREAREQLNDICPCVSWNFTLNRQQRRQVWWMRCRIRVRRCWIAILQLILRGLT